MTYHELTLGSLQLTGDPSFPDPEHGFWFEVSAEGTEFGSPEAVTRIIDSLLADGANVIYDRDGNRSIPVRVRAHGPTLAAVAHGEAALRRETKRNNELKWQPDDEFAPPSVYETYPSPMRVVAESGWDLDEKLRRLRTVSLQLACSPFARSAKPVVVEAQEVAAGGEVVFDTCDSATGWTASVNGVSVAPDTTWEAGAVSVKELLNPAPQTLTLARTGIVDFVTTPYLVAEIGYNGNLGLVPVTCEVDGRVLPPAATRLIAPGWYLYWWTVGEVASSITFSSYTDAPYADLKIRKLTRIGVPSPQPRQVTRVLDVGGTERTAGSLQIASRDANDLGMTMVHTTPASDVRGATGYSPSLRQWRTFGNTVITDAARLSGFSEPLSPNPFVVQVPNVAIPDGPYFVAAMLRSSATLTSRIHWTVRTVTDDGDGINVVGEEERVSSFNFTAGAWTLVPLGVISLPVAQAMDAVTRLDVESEAGDPATIHIDDLYLFWAAEGCGLTIVSNAKKRLWLDTPDLGSRVPTYWTGTDPSRVDAYHPGDGLLTPGEHSLIPGAMRAWVATSGTTYPGVSGSWFERWHTNAAR